MMAERQIGKVAARSQSACRRSTSGDAWARLITGVLFAHLRYFLLRDSAPKPCLVFRSGVAVVGRIRALPFGKSGGQRSKVHWVCVSMHHRQDS